MEKPNLLRIYINYLHCTRRHFFPSFFFFFGSDKRFSHVHRFLQICASKFSAASFQLLLVFIESSYSVPLNINHINDQFDCTSVAYFLR